MDVNSLSHSKWNCKYHIVFAPKFRRKVAYGALRQDIANILSMLCKRKGVNISRSRDMSGTRVYACGDSAKYQRSEFCGL